MTNTTIVIIGGGYIGVVTAIHLARYSQQPLNICIIETSSSLGEGVAFGTGDKDHRLNGPSGIQFLYPENTESFTEWHENLGAKPRIKNQLRKTEGFLRAVQILGNISHPNC